MNGLKTLTQYYFIKCYGINNTITNNGLNTLYNNLYAIYYDIITEYHKMLYK